ncbi:MAG: DUF4199 domain-containing protein [Rikenellaceae bacterium]|nr:DUF4199 domain-containing protein [Rikenellaceae bacterium]MBR2419762.1 DUF4199 domain-containing protein [Rikenellaceae bacterium]MBR3800787.1 DUF4199 domain-containing protein [Rikenellaceae bacterium]
MNNNYLLRASIAGAVIGAVSVALDLLQVCCPFAGIGFIGFAAMVGLIWYYARGYAQSCGSAGCSYGQVLGFIVVSMVFAGVLYGAVKAVAVNTFAEEEFRILLDKSMDMIKQMGIYSKAQIKQMNGMMDTIQFNPIFIVISSVFSMVFNGVLYGLVIAAFTRREADPFAEEISNEE